jgi:hypothetical protein
VPWPWSPAAPTASALPDPVVAILHQRTEGWAAGLRLAVLSLAGHPDPEQFIAEFSGSDRTVAEYLMAEVLDRQPPQVQRLLLRTSVLDRVNGGGAVQRRTTAPPSPGSCLVRRGQSTPSALARLAAPRDQNVARVIALSTVRAG